MARIIQIITLLFLSLLMMSSSCDKGTEGCTDSNACNFNETAAIDDNSCWFSSEGCDCNNLQGSTVDCLGVCDTNIENDPPDDDGDGICNQEVFGGCVDTLSCNYNINATHNDGTCADDLSDFGGLADGSDCNGDCGGIAVEDDCELCIGGSTNLGQSWRIKINSIATFKLQDDTSMGADTNSVTLGTSIYALDGYNGTELNGGDSSCDNCYIDYPEPKITGFEDKNNFIRFYFPHDASNEWDEWGSQIDLEIEPLFDSDIRKNDYHSLFTEEKGLNWFAIVEPTLSDTIIFNENENAESFETILDSIYFQVTHLEWIKCSQIKIALDRDKGEVVDNFDYVIENNQLGIKVDTDKSFSVLINISNICIQEFEESCPDGL
ncbi:MAG: hypothetical protein H8E85_03235 [Candidatus Marinimicrobia bacterium]|nr:hypothetical protein [Candidatus Neomarinimicrobiota bacterium]